MRADQPKPRPNNQRACVNLALIWFTTFQVYFVLSSHIYIRGELVKSFLSVYTDDTLYPDLFSGASFSLSLVDISDLQQHLQFMFTNMQSSMNESFLGIDYSSTDITLEVQYIPELQNSHRKDQFPIKPQDGIVTPFDSDNLTSIQIFLLQVQWFSIVIHNVRFTSENFTEVYEHELVYRFESRAQIEVNFIFAIQDQDLSSSDPKDELILDILKGFYILVLLLNAYSFYLNGKHLNRKVQLFFKQKYRVDTESIANKSQRVSLGISDYLFAIPPDVFFSVCSNSFGCVGTLLLLTSQEKPVLLGLSCLFAWLTIFKLISNSPRLIMMYQIYTTSFKVIGRFFVSFIVIFMSYAIFGVCVFGRCDLFCSPSKAITTLTCLIFGDSICMITNSIADKYGSVMAGAYIFSFVILFMQAIHNTLTSLLKEFFVCEKIRTLREEKKARGHEGIAYLEQRPCQIDCKLSMERVLLTPQLKKEILLLRRQCPFRHLETHIRSIFHTLERLILSEKWLMEDHHLEASLPYRVELMKRLKILHQITSNPVLTELKAIIDSQPIFD